MTNSTLFIRSLAVITLLAGFAHLFAYVSQKNEPKVVPELIDTDFEDINADTVSKNVAEKITTNVIEPKKEKFGRYNPDTDYIVGKWKVTYNSDEFKGSVIYDFKKEGKIFNAYTFQYEDEKGYSQKAEGTKTLTIQEFDGYKGKGIYMLEYEGEKYDVACQIDMVDENTFKLSYDYYGYGDVETWKRF